MAEGTSADMHPEELDGNNSENDVEIPRDDPPHGSALFLRDDVLLLDPLLHFPELGNEELNAGLKNDRPVDSDEHSDLASSGGQVETNQTDAMMFSELNGHYHDKDDNCDIDTASESPSIPVDLLSDQNLEALVCSPDAKLIDLIKTSKSSSFSNNGNIGKGSMENGGLFGKLQEDADQLQVKTSQLQLGSKELKSNIEHLKQVEDLLHKEIGQLQRQISQLQGTKEQLSGSCEQSVGLESPSSPQLQGSPSDEEGGKNLVLDDGRQLDVAMAINGHTQQLHGCESKISGGTEQPCAEKVDMKAKLQADLSQVCSEFSRSKEQESLTLEVQPGDKKSNDIDINHSFMEAVCLASTDNNSSGTKQLQYLQREPVVNGAQTNGTVLTSSTEDSKQDAEQVTLNQNQQQESLCHVQKTFEENHRRETDKGSLMEQGVVEHSATNSTNNGLGNSDKIPSELQIQDVKAVSVQQSKLFLNDKDVSDHTSTKCNQSVAEGLDFRDSERSNICDNKEVLNISIAGEKQQGSTFVETLERGILLDKRSPTQNDSDYMVVERDVSLEDIEVLSGHHQMDLNPVEINQVDINPSDPGPLDQEEKDGQSITEKCVYGFDGLPIEIIHKILSYCTHHELCISVSLVSKLWHSYAYDPIHWQYLEVSKQISLTSFNDLISKTPLLKKIHFTRRAVVKEEELQTLGLSCLMLQELNLGFCDILDSMVEVIGQLFMSLEVLNLEGNEEITDNCIPWLCRLPKLRWLSLSHCPAVMNESVILLGRSLDGLEFLDIDGLNHVLDDGVISLTETRASSLHHLKLDGDGLTNESVKAVSENCPHLQTFHLSFAELLTDDIVDYIQELTQLRDFRLKKATLLSASALRCMFVGSTLRQLTALDLTECASLSDDGLIQIVKCCGTCLKQLSLCWCWNLTDQAVTAIVDTCRNLVKLDLTGLDVIRGTALARVPTDLPRLVHLDLSQCNRIDDAMIMDMLRKKPDLMVVNYYGEEFRSQFEIYKT